MSALIHPVIKFRALTGSQDHCLGGKCPALEVALIQVSNTEHIEPLVPPPVTLALFKSLSSLSTYSAPRPSKKTAFKAGNTDLWQSSCPCYLGMVRWKTDILRVVRSLKVCTQRSSGHWELQYRYGACSLEEEKKMQQLLPFLTLLPFNTGLHAVVTSTVTLFLLLLCICNLATVMSHDVNICFPGDPCERSFDLPQRVTTQRLRITAFVPLHSGCILFLDWICCLESAEAISGTWGHSVVFIPMFS